MVTADCQTIIPHWIAVQKSIIAAVYCVFQEGIPHLVPVIQLMNKLLLLVTRFHYLGNELLLVRYASSFRLLLESHKMNY